MDLKVMTKAQLYELYDQEVARRQKAERETTSVVQDNNQLKRELDQTNFSLRRLEFAIDFIRASLIEEGPSFIKPSGDWVPMDAASRGINLDEIPGLIGQLIGQRDELRRQLEARR